MLKTAQNKEESNVGIWRSVLMLQTVTAEETAGAPSHKNRRSTKAATSWVGLPVSFWNTCCRLLTVPDKNILSLFDHLAYNQKSIQKSQAIAELFSLYLHDVCLFGLFGIRSGENLLLLVPLCPVLNIKNPAKSP